MTSFRGLEDRACANGHGVVRQLWEDAGRPGSYFYWLLDRWASWMDAGCPGLTRDEDEGSDEDSLLSLKHRPGAHEAMVRWAAVEIGGVPVSDPDTCLIMS
jgi:hypothetical protein